MKLTVSDGSITMLPLDVRVGGAYFSFVLFNIIKIYQYSSTFDFMHIKFSQTLSLYMLFSLKHNKYGPSLGSGEVYSIQHYVIKFVSDLQQVGDFLRVLWFPSTRKLTVMI